MRNSTIKPKKGQCVDCPEGSEKYLTAGRCEYHYKKHRAKINVEKKESKNENNEEAVEIKKPKAIPKVSEKRKKENKQYKVKRLQFLAQPKNLRCPVTGQIATEIHHMKGRIGNLLLDEKHWLAVSREGHKKIEENPEWAKEMGYSISRI